MKIEFGGADELKDNLDEKLKSPFWGSMIATWLTWNWKVWYVTIFVSHENIGKYTNKIEYIKSMYEYFDFYYLFGMTFQWVLMPLLLSIFIIKVVTPYISLWFKKQHRDNKVEENKIKIAELKLETEVLEAEEVKIEQEQKVEKKKEKSEEEKWDEEYSKIENIDELKEKISNLIFKYKGKDKHRHGHDMIDSIEPNYLRDAIIHDFIQEAERNASIITYKITTKGKDFLSKEKKKED